MNNFIFILIILVLLIISLIKDRKKTVEGIKDAKNMGKGNGKEIIVILALVSLILALLPNNLIIKILGGKNNILSNIYAAIIGTITIIPAFVAFPMSAELIEKGASVVAISSFITTLTMVGFATLPIEIRYFGKKFAYARNFISFILAIIISLFMGVFL